MFYRENVLFDIIYPTTNNQEQLDVIVKHLFQVNDTNILLQMTAIYFNRC